MSQEPPDTVEHEDVHYCFHGSEFWYWQNSSQQWVVLPECPSFLRLVGSVLVVVQEDGRHECACSSFQVNNYGCKCGGV